VLEFGEFGNGWSACEAPPASVDTAEVEDPERACGDDDLHRERHIGPGTPLRCGLLERQPARGRSRGGLPEPFLGRRPPDRKKRVTLELHDLPAVLVADGNEWSERAVEDLRHLLRPCRATVCEALGERCEAGNVEREARAQGSVSLRGLDREWVLGEPIGDDRWYVAHEDLGMRRREAHVCRVHRPSPTTRSPCNPINAPRSHRMWVPFRRAWRSASSATPGNHRRRRGLDRRARLPWPALMSPRRPIRAPCGARGLAEASDWCAVAPPARFHLGCQ
jgi:hypothetical protein